MQNALAEYVQDGNRPDQILILEHNPVFTLGRGANETDIHVSKAHLSKNGIEIHRINRGGQVTYHGPGQIVVYPICNLRGGRQNVARLVNGLEQAMIETALDFGVIADRLDGYPGIWVNTSRGIEKLGAVGIHLKKWVSTHGIAFNLEPAMESFQWITPCGITDKGVCSLRSILGEDCPTWEEACQSLTGHISEILAIEPIHFCEPSQSVSVTVWRHNSDGPEVLVMLRCPSEGQWWSSVTGMVEAGETAEMAAYRETMEETGLSGKLTPLNFQHSFWVDPALVNVHGNEPQFNTEICFHIEVPSDSQVVLNKAEHSEYRWCAPSEALELMRWEGSKAVLNMLIRDCWVDTKYR
ncbi:MAG: lipoyl(octanoyl) transferase LipB [Holophagaceae bacterium]|nr:lipoyl(octanoyl) transferase LipB [Holophagaceae bacterium]